jgi:hypothetical protein
VNNKVTVTGANSLFLAVTALCFVFSLVVAIADVFFKGFY